MAPRWASIAVPLAGFVIAALLAPRRPHFVAEADLTDDELEAHLANHSFVHLGGQHRGGTTLLWSGLGTHTAFASHGPWKFAAVRELHGEGLFLQDVYPRMSLDHPRLFLVRKRLLRLGCTVARVAVAAVFGRAEADGPWLSERCRMHEGVGGYALGGEPRPSPDASANRQSARALLSQWSVHWGASGMSRPWLLEKSPSNALIAPWLSGIWASYAAPVRFIFLTRHPIMQAMAMRAFVDDLSTRDLVVHWLAVEGAARAAVRVLPPGSVALTSLEALAAEPAKVVGRLLCWLASTPAPSNDDGDDEEEEGSASRLARECPVSGADAVAGSPWAATEAAQAWLRFVRRRPNAAYRSEYAAGIGASSEAASAHAALVEEFDERVGVVGGYGLADTGTYEAPPIRDATWVQRYVDDATHRLGGRSLLVL